MQQEIHEHMGFLGRFHNPFCYLVSLLVTAVWIGWSTFSCYFLSSAFPGSLNLALVHSLPSLRHIRCVLCSGLCPLAPKAPAVPLTAREASGFNSPSCSLVKESIKHPQEQKKKTEQSHFLNVMNKMEQERKPQTNRWQEYGVLGVLGFGVCFGWVFFIIP